MCLRMVRKFIWKPLRIREWTQSLQSSGPAGNDVRGNQASVSAPTGHGAWAWPKSLIQDALLSLSGSKVFFFHFYARTWLLYS